MSLKDLDQASVQAPQLPVSAEEVLVRMRMGKATVSEIKMGTQVIPVRVLSADEVNAVRNEAKAKTAKSGGDETDQNLYIQKITLQLASTVTADRIPFLTDKIMKQLSVDEIGFLYTELVAFWDTFNPGLEQISAERFKELVAALKKNNVSWKDCSTPERKAIFTCFQDMIQQQASPTSPQAS